VGFADACGATARLASISLIEAGRIERLTAQFTDLRCDRVGLQNAIELAEHLPTRAEVEKILVEIREMITSGTLEDHKTLTSVLVGPTRVEDRHSIQPSFIAPTQKVRVLSGVVRPAGIEPAALRSGAELARGSERCRPVPHGSGCIHRGEPWASSGSARLRLGPPGRSQLGSQVPP
jgi:hypothetical protein